MTNLLDNAAKWSPAGGEVEVTLHDGVLTVRFDAVLRVAGFAALVAARTCERAGAELPRAARVDAEWCFA